MTSALLQKMPSTSASLSSPVPKKGEYNFKQVPLNDQRVWALFHRGRTKGVFQLEKQLGQDWSRRVRPSNLEELAILVSLLRPGPLESNMSEDFVKRKFGEQEITYLHPKLEDILRATLGLLVFQEQALRIAIEIAGFTEVEADMLRKGMGKKLPEVVAKCHVQFLEKSLEKGIVTKEQSEEIFSWIQKFQRYGFNKSHAISYAKTSYVSAYMKTHFPTEFYTSWLTFSSWKPNQKEEVYELVQDARLSNVSVMPPDVRKKNVDFEIIGDRKIIFGLSHIRSVGDHAIGVIQKTKSDFSTLTEFIKSAKGLKRNVAESLVKSGACDCYGVTRTEILKTLYILLGRTDGDKGEVAPEYKALTPNEYHHVYNNIDKLGLGAALQDLIDREISIKKRFPVIEAKIKALDTPTEETNAQRAIWEKLYLGLNLTCSAADDYEKIDPNVKNCRDTFLLPNKAKVVLHVVIDKVREMKTSEKAKNPGQKYCYLSVSDNTGALQSLVLWPELYERVSHEIHEGVVATIFGRKDSWKGREQIVVDKVVIIG